MKSSSLSLLLIAVILTAMGCHSSQDSSPATQPGASEADQSSASKNLTVQIPDLPLSTGSVLTIDADMIADLARAYYAQSGQSISPQAFFLGQLPLWSADQLCNASSDQATIGKLLGNLFVSGYFGGIWLRDALQTESQSTTAAALQTVKASLPNELIIAALPDTNTLLSDTIIAIAWQNVRNALTGSDTAVMLSARLSIEPFLMIYGYNWGYFNYILTNPPTGSTPSELYLHVCKRLLDCELPGVQLTTLTRYQPVLDQLYPENDDSSSLRWLEMRAALALWGQGSVQTGAGVWEHIMNNQMSGPVYELLLDLSARFMLIAELCLLPTMQGYADGDDTAARCGLLQEAGMIVWAGSYFMGLASSAPVGTFPQIVIEE